MEQVAERNALILQHVRDPESEYYRGLMRMLRDASARAAQVRLSKPRVELPFKLEERDVVALEEQFRVRVVSKGSNLRAVMSPRVAGMVACADEMMMEHAGGPGRKMLLLDADVVTAAVRGFEGKVIERTWATPRLAAGYGNEEEALAQMAASGRREINVRAQLIVRETLEGGGPHYSPRVRVDGPQVEAMLVNHFRTPAGPHQLAYTGKCRGAVVWGVFPFQVEMRYADEGELLCFPGRFVIDRKADLLTLIPRDQASMSITHPYQALMDLALNNSVTVDGEEFLLERYMAVKGVMCYTLRHVDADFEAPETIRSYYYSQSDAELTELTFPEVKYSADGVPIGFTRGKVRCPTARLQKVLSRVACTAEPIIRPAHAYNAFMDYNNLVINTIDTAVPADRIDPLEQGRLALAVALHANYRRHSLKGTMASVVAAMKRRHSVVGDNAVRLAWAAMAAVVCSPRVDQVGEVTDLESQRIVDWCGNDFSVVAAEVDPWCEVAQVAGTKERSEGWYASWLPKPPVVRQKVSKEVPAVRVASSVRGAPGLSSLKSASTSASTVTLVDRYDITKAPSVSGFSDIKERLRGKMRQEQGAVAEVPMAMRRASYRSIMSDDLGSVPVPDVDPLSAIRNDLLVANKGLPQREAVATGFRIAETDIVKDTRGHLEINDAKRVIPKGAYVRLPRVDAGVEGVRVPSQASLMGAVLKRNIGIPNNRGFVNLDALPEQAVDRLISVCFRDGWEGILNQHLNTGLWEPNGPDVDDFIANVDESKARDMLDEFFIEGEVRLDRWLLMAKGKVKPSREAGAESKVDHAQTIMYLENKSTNGMYSSITRRFKKALDEMMRPEVALNPQWGEEEHEEWYNSLEAVRRSFPATYSYGSDIRCYDRSQEHPGLRAEMALYRRMGLNRERFERWERTHGPKRAMSMMWGVVFVMVLGGVSGLWKTLLRNGLINLMAVIVTSGITYRDLVMIDVKGDDMDLELSRPLNVADTADGLGAMFNLSAKFFTNDVRYMCKKFRVRVKGRWYFITDPWTAVQSLCTPIRMGGERDALIERWKSLVANLRHYQNGILVDAVVEAAQVYYGIPHCFAGMAYALSMFARDEQRYCNFFEPPKLIS